MSQNFHKITKTKICNKCKQEKPVSEFAKDNNRRDKLRSLCKSCDNKRRAEYDHKCRQSITSKVCLHCKQEKSILEFSKDSGRKDKLQVWCKSCQNESRKKSKSINNQSPTPDIIEKNKQYTSKFIGSSITKIQSINNHTREVNYNHNDIIQMTIQETKSKNIDDLILQHKIQLTILNHLKEKST